MAWRQVKGGEGIANGMIDGGSVEIGARHDGCSKSVESGGLVEIPAPLAEDQERDTDVESEAVTVTCEKCGDDVSASVVSGRTEISFVVEGPSNGWSFFVRNLTSGDSN